MESRRIGAFLRFTGLRICQALGVLLAHLDLDAGTLQVVIGKSRQEEAEQRIVPISWHLVEDLRAWTTGRKPDDFLFPAWGAHTSKHAAVRAIPFNDAWREATRWGEAREAVWSPTNRKIARPQHAFRAGFQGFLRGKGVGEEVIDGLMGHHGRSIRTRHYAGADRLWDRMREAVDLLPPVDWLGPQELKEGNVVEIKRRGRRAGGAMALPLDPDVGSSIRCGAPQAEAAPEPKDGAF